MQTDKMVLVTGADGFIGSHLVERLLQTGYRVRAFVLYNSFNSWGWLEGISTDLKERLEVVAGDIRDPYFVNKAVEGVDTIFHLAALIAIPFSYHAPDSYVDTNIKGTLNILNAARSARTARVLVTSTSEVYGTARFVPITEEHFRQPQSPYSASKIAADCMAESFFRSFELPVTIVRPFNTYGPRQSARAVIPATIIQLLSGNEYISLGDLSPTRDLLFVKDTVEGFISVAGCEALIGQDVNIATQSEISIGELVQEIISQINPNAYVVADKQRIRPANSEVYRLFGSYEKLNSHTGWSPKYSLRQGIVETIEWFRKKENLERYKADIYNV
jgi:NAD dependent epimerase/dehydratase